MINHIFKATINYNIQVILVPYQLSKKGHLSDLIMESYMKEVGMDNQDRVMGYKYGLMVLDMKGNGIIIRQMDKENLYMLMEMFMMASGMMIKPLEVEHITIIMVLSIVDNGWMINSMDMEFKHGLMDQNTKVFMIWEKKMVKENIFGKMEVIMMVVGSIIKSLVKEHISGQMVGDMKEIGSIIKCMDMDVMNGKMAGNMKDNIN